VDDLINWKNMRKNPKVPPDVVAATSKLAGKEKSAPDKVHSQLVGQSRLPRLTPVERSNSGFRTIPRGGFLVTPEHVNEIREAEGV
jgi:hypothetical protein